MCLTKVYYNTYSDGTQDVTEKTYPCRDGRACSHPEVRKYDRKFPFTKLGEARTESHKSLSERKPTPYFRPHTPRGSKSPSPSGRRNSDVYMSGAKHYDHRDPYARYDLYDYRPSSRHDPRDRHDQEARESRSKRSTAMPQIVYLDRDKPSRSRSRSSSREYSRDVPLGIVNDEYGRRHSSRSRSREESREGSDHSKGHYRRRSDEPLGYVFIDDHDERRRQRREQRRMSTSSYPELSASAPADVYDPSRYIPRRASSTVVQRSEGSTATASSTTSSKPKQLRWEDQVRAKRDRQNAEIANRPIVVGEPKGILKHTDSKSKSKDQIDELRRSIARMDIPRGRDREPRSTRWYDEGRPSMVMAGGDRYNYY